MARILLAIMTLACGAALLGGCGDADPVASTTPEPAPEEVLTPDAVGEAARGRTASPAPRGGKVVEITGVGRDREYSRSSVSPGAPSDAEVRAELRAARAELAKFKRFLTTTAYLQTGPRAKVLADGTAVAPEDAPDAIKRIIQAGNAIAKFPYKWGGGHGAWRDDGYDCSGSVSFALAAAGLVRSPLTSGGFLDWGAAGTGEWLTIYTNPGHIFMIVAGLRFDTSGRGRAGTRWQAVPRGATGFATRHIPGL